MKKCIYTLLIAVFTLSPLQLFAQNKMSIRPDVNRSGTRVYGDQEYNQSKIHRVRTQFYQHALQVAAMQQQKKQAAPKVGINPDGFPGKSIINTSFLQTRFGFTSFYTYRLRQNLYLVGELGYFYNSSDLMNRNINDPLGRWVDERLNPYYHTKDLYEVALYPVYGGIRRGIILKNLLKRFYPYVGAGAGPVLGMGFVRDQFGSNQSFQLVPSVYAMVGTEIYTTNKWFFDVSVRYRYLTFGRYLANWKNFSGITLNFGFGYGIGQQILR